MPPSIAQKLQQAIAAHDRQEWETAERLYLEVLEEDPGHSGACLRMALMALQADYPKDAVEWAGKALQAEPHNVEALALRAKAHVKAGDFSSAIADLRKAVVVAPANRALRLDLAHRLGSCGLAAEALQHFAAVGEQPPSPLTLAGTAHAWQTLGRMDQCRKLIGRQLELLPGDAMVRSQWIAIHAGDESLTPQTAFRMASEWQDHFGCPSDPLPTPSPAPQKGDRPLRVGFVATTFHHHANCNFLLPLLEALPATGLATYAYHDGRIRDAVTARCENAVDHWRAIVGQSPRRAAELIRADEIDVLVDITGHYDSGRLRIFTYRPAAVQVHYLGGFGTTGLKSIDWRLADDLTEPPDAQSALLSSERVHRLAGGIHAYRPLAETAAPNASPCGTQPFVTFGCLNALTKIEPGMLRLWGELLAAIPDSRLLLVKDVFRDPANREQFLEWAATHGIRPSQLELKAAPREAHRDLSVYHSIDIALDTLPYNGITTTFEALWMGVPVVTMRGNRFVAREAAAILTRCGHPQWIAATPDEYISIATELASQRNLLQQTRQSLRRDLLASPLTDANRLAREFAAFCQTAAAKIGAG